MRIVSSAVYVKDTGTPRGRGVFAARSFGDGEVVETCPVVPFTEGPALPSEIRRIMFSWGYLLTGSPGSQAIVLGYGSVYNHDNPANMRYEADATNQVLRFVAVRNIDADEELTINYNAQGGGAEWNDDAWFKRMNVEPIIHPQGDGTAGA